MRIIKLAIVGVLLVFPLYIILGLRIAEQRQALLTELRYNAAIDAAVDDAAKALILNADQGKEAQYDSAKRMSVNKEEAIQAFYRTLYMNFGVWEDTISQGDLNRYIPAVVVIGYDGYWVYAEDEFTNAVGEKELRPVWGPKKPYAYVDAQGNSLSFTLDDYVTAYEQSSGSWKHGFRSEIGGSSAIPLLHDAATFEQVRRSTIVNAIQNELAYRINLHNRYAARAGISYTFTLPTISQEDWNSTIDDIGVLAFVQGIPMGTGTYNNYALGGSRVLQKQVYAAALKNGIPYYYLRSCSMPYPVRETFSYAKNAAQQGYIPLSCANSSSK
ncbi:hypothetical protein B5M42_020910 [Paenibacillus athensensis]|uniref:F0F1-type ATP synthase n=1 Tax=Paenibacillus athensensis TaxID=1967502 RepID=A0A4Y8PZK4_9BACL|nr:hypothetical protein [Paenibacillus athensensis]MCD1261265.1 hypothetical protein [Paenibacillus athensensis]